MTRTQKFFALFVSAFVFFLSGFCACIWLSGIEGRSVELGLASFFSFIISIFLALLVPFAVRDFIFYGR